MFVNQIRRAAFHAVVAMIFRCGYLLDGVVELRKPSIVTAGTIEPVFVANFDVAQLERFGITV